MIPTSFLIGWAVPEETECLVERPAVDTPPYSHPDVFIYERFQSLDVFLNSSGQFIVVASCLVAYWALGLFIKHHNGDLSEIGKFLYVGFLVTTKKKKQRNFHNVLTFIKIDT